MSESAPVSTESLAVLGIKTDRAGPRLLVLGAVHGNETCGPRAIEKVLADFEADTERHTLLNRLETAEPEEMGEIWARLIEIDADAAPARAAEILVGLGFGHDDQQRPMSEFSGGWRMRVALAAALFAEPDMLLLDEPTNYLDLEGALWLEARLSNLRAVQVYEAHGYRRVGQRRALLNSNRSGGASARA